MNDTNTQPDSGSQEGANLPVADNLGKFDERSIADFIKNNFLDEEGAAPAKEEQQTESQTEEPVAEESLETEPEVQDEVDQSNDEEVDGSQLSRGVQKRINKLVAAKKAAQAKLQEQEAKLAGMQRELEAAKSLATNARQQSVSNEIEALNSIPEVEAEYKRAVDVLMWCEDNPDGGEIQGPDGQIIELTDKQVRAMKKAAIRNKEVELPARFQYLQQQQAALPQIVQSFPWINKPESQEYQAAQAVLRDFPEIRRRPDYLHVVGVFVEGLKAFTERSSAAKTAAPIKRAPAQPSVKAPPAQPKDDTVRAKKAFLQDTSNRDGLSNLLKANGFV
jgi:hypothetical protein